MHTDTPSHKALEVLLNGDTHACVFSHQLIASLKRRGLVTVENSRATDWTPVVSITDKGMKVVAPTEWRIVDVHTTPHATVTVSTAEGEDRILIDFDSGVPIYVARESPEGVYIGLSAERAYDWLV